MTYIVQDEMVGRSFNITHCDTFEEAKLLFEGRKEARRTLYPVYGDLGCPVILELVESDERNPVQEFNDSLHRTKTGETE